MATKKSGGTAKNLRDSNPKYLGTKLYAGETAGSGSIIIRQRGTKILAGKNVRIGRDHTLYSATDGIVSFSTKRKTSFNGKVKRMPIVTVTPTK